MTTTKCDLVFNEENLRGVDLLKLVIQTSFGPNGKLKMLQNTCGGHVALTSSASRLLKSVVIANPINKLIASAAMAHLKCHGNDGLFLMLFTMELLERALNLEVPRPLVSSICEKLARAMISHLKDCSLKIRVDFSSIALPMTLLGSILKSKRACSLSERQQNHLARLLMKGFLDCVPDPSSNSEKVGNIHFVSCTGMSPDHCQMTKGIFIESCNSKLIDLPGERLKCALFHVSLSGDFETDLDIANWTVHHELNTVKMCSALILKLCEQLVTDDVSVVACQKVIHPGAKKYLADHGVLAIDRLGLVAFGGLLELTGASPIETFVGSVDQSCFGVLHKISIITLNKKTFYHLQNEDSLVSSLFLCHFHEESLEELVVVCQQAIGALRGLLSVPYVWCGGGCFETHLAAYVRHWGKKNLLQLTRNGASKGQVLSTIEVFAKSLECIATSLTKQGNDILTGIQHHFSLAVDSNPMCFDTGSEISTCECGLMTKGDSADIDDMATRLARFSVVPADEHVEWKESAFSEEKLDSLKVVDAALSKQEALKSALETFLMLLDVDTVITLHS